MCGAQKKLGGRRSWRNEAKKFGLHLTVRHAD
jgi:hypothetical protein